MTTLLANPIYDTVFKFLMDDKKVAKHILSAFLKKKVIDVQMRNTENVQFIHKYKLNLYRLDFTATVLNEDGTRQQVIIELQKSAANLQVQRFRKYLGGEYLKSEVDNEIQEKDPHYEIPIISIYLLGHRLKEVRVPVIYVTRSYFDYEDNIINGRDPFIESLTHDSIVVQIPLLNTDLDDPLNKILRFFYQKKSKTSKPYVEFNLEELELESDKSYQAIAQRLLLAASTEEVRKQMEAEAEIVTAIEWRDTAILEKDQILEQKDLILGQKDQEIEQKEQEIEQKEQEIEQKEQEIEQKDLILGQKDQEIEQKEQEIEQKDLILGQKDQEIEQKDRTILSAIQKLKRMKMTTAQISEILSISENEIVYLSSGR